MPAAMTVGVINPQTQKKEIYEGVRVEDLLRKACVPLGEKMRRPAMASYVVAEAEDSCRVVFSLAELDSGIAADTMDSLRLGVNFGGLPGCRIPREASCARGAYAQVSYGGDSAEQLNE